MAADLNPVYHPYSGGGQSLSDFAIYPTKSGPDCCDRFLSNLWQGLVKLIKKIVRFVFCCFSKTIPPYERPSLSLEKRFDSAEIQEMQKAWNQLGKKKWKEFLPVSCHEKGKSAFEASEPGYMKSLQKNLFPLVREYLGTRTTTEFIKRVHEAACWHFDREETNTLISRDKIGQFRDKGFYVYNSYKISDDVTRADWQEHVQMEPSLAKIRYASETKERIRVDYYERSSTEIETLLDRYLEVFYSEIDQAAGDKTKKIRAIAKLCKQMYFTHPPYDGSTRMRLAITQKHLCEYLGHPAVFDNFKTACRYSLDKLTRYIEETALPAWKRLTT